MAGRKPRATYTIHDDIAALKELLSGEGSGVFDAGTADEKLQHWMAAAARLSVGETVYTSDGLRRRVADLVRKHNAQADNTNEPRMRWGMVWPKSDEEIELENLVSTFIKRQQASDAVIPRPSLKKKAKQGRVPTQTTPTVRADPSPKRARPTIVANNDREISVTTPDLTSSHPVEVVSPQHEPGLGDLERRRLEMEERIQHRILDIQTTQIELQREQLRQQSEIMRALTESTQAIARALQRLDR